MAFITVSAFSTMLEELFGPPEACGVVKYENFFKQMNKFLNRNENKADFLQKESTIFIQREIESTIRDSTLEEEQKKQYKSIFERDFEHIKRYQELFSEIASSETEEEFRDAVGKFIGYFKEAGDFLPLVRSEGDEKNYDALWTNNGADSPHDDPVISENLLNEDKSFEIHVDYQRSPLLSRLWALVREPNPVGGSFIEQLQQGAETQRDFPSELTYYYDKILDPIFAEKIAESHSTNEVYRISFDNELKKLFNREESDGPRRYGAFINFLKANRAVLENKLEIGLPKDLCDGPAAELRVCTGFDGIMECLIDKSTLSAEIKEEYKKLSKEDNQHIKMHKELLEKIENSRDEKEFRDSVGEFIDHFKNSYFLPMDNINDNREKYALWTNGGIEGGLLDDKSRGYREYQDDSKSCLMRHIWNIVKDRCASDSKTPVKNGGFIEHLRKKSQSEETHINYDKILSEIYVEKMGPEKLTSLRIEYRQNIINPKYAKMHSGRVFYANELPVLLETTAKHNIELDKEYRKKIEELERKYKLLGQ
ncbi:MAG: hypothetical protein LBI70_01820, partial [Rickettsiales bacterium]|nr:hypothetical protein [Rickettsiales bacterium]